MIFHQGEMTIRLLLVSHILSCGVNRQGEHKH